MKFQLVQSAIMAFLAQSISAAVVIRQSKEASIYDMLGSNPTLVSNTTDYNGVFYQKHDDDPNEESKVGGGAPFGCSTGNLCDCQPRRFKSFRWETQSTSQFRGGLHRISEPLCPPGTISKSYTYSYSYQVSVQAGPDLKQPLIAAIDKLGIRAGFSYTWGHAESSQYTVQCNDPKNNHPCVETFSPMIGVISGIGYSTVEVPGGKVCSRGDSSHMTIHVPVVQSPDCQGTSSTCGAQGIYDSCYYAGDYARQLCPNRNLGTIPNGRVCPSNTF